MKYLMSCLLAVLACFQLVEAQQVNRCGFDHAVQQMEQQHPGYKAQIDAALLHAKELALANNKADDSTIYRIPVVVHIVYSTPAGNLPDSVVFSQMEVLNEDFRRLNADTTDTRSIFKQFAGDAGIEFYLATEDPQGNPTSGITRTSSSNTNGFGISFDDIKSDASAGIDPWDVDNYLNIWVGDLSLFGFPAILGVAYPPAGAPNWPANSTPTDKNLQGVVVHYQVFGRNNPLASGPLSVTDRGRTATHEVGHYLGLRHIWGDGGGFGGPNGCTVDDFIDDTPNASDASQQTCNLNQNTCTDSPTDYPDMIENYMDYAEERCMNMFTKQQVEIMRSNLVTYRSDLYDVVEDTTTPPVGITDVPLNELIQVYPNPTSGTISITSSGQAFNSISVYDLLGKQVYFEQGAGFGVTTTIDLSDMSKGLYYLQIEGEEGFAVKRIVVE